MEPLAVWKVDPSSLDPSIQRIFEILNSIKERTVYVYQVLCHQGDLSTFNNWGVGCKILYISISNHSIPSYTFPYLYLYSCHHIYVKYKMSFVLKYAMIFIWIYKVCFICNIFLHFVFIAIFPSTGCKAKMHNFVKCDMDICNLLFVSIILCLHASYSLFFAFSDLVIKNLFLQFLGRYSSLVLKTYCHLHTKNDNVVFFFLNLIILNC
jgi:hypothetical protein